MTDKKQPSGFRRRESPNPEANHIVDWDQMTADDYEEIEQFLEVVDDDVYLQDQRKAAVFARQSTLAKKRQLADTNSLRRTSLLQQGNISLKYGGANMAIEIANLGDEVVKLPDFKIEDGNTPVSPARVTQLLF